jgi:hypothetical protein
LKIPECNRLYKKKGKCLRSTVGTDRNAGGILKTNDYDDDIYTIEFEIKDTII